MSNNQQIDDTNYYQLPCGKFLEDFIAWKHLDFATGSAVKYKYRAGFKDGETEEKDLKKAKHYIKFNTEWLGGFTEEETEAYIDNLVKEAKEWDGEMKPIVLDTDLKEDTPLRWCDVEMTQLALIRAFIKSERKKGRIIRDVPSMMFEFIDFIFSNINEKEDDCAN